MRIFRKPDAEKRNPEPEKMKPDAEKPEKKKEEAADERRERKNTPEGEDIRVFRESRRRKGPLQDKGEDFHSH